jgi:hypothetical protein
MNSPDFVEKVITRALFNEQTLSPKDIIAEAIVKFSTDEKAFSIPTDSPYFEADGSYRRKTLSGQVSKIEKEYETSYVASGNI